MASDCNANTFTYDGIEVCAERLVKEIEAYLHKSKTNGSEIQKISFIGYSLGGLVARYAIGLLYHKGYFKKLLPVNFTTFATPHLGSRAPLRGYATYVWNTIGARALSTSGRQLFMIDNFRNSGKPLLSVLADPESIFIHALRQFTNRSLYTNIVNDRSAAYYTTAISRTDPYVDVDNLELHHLPNYEPVILDPNHSFDLRTQTSEHSTYYRHFVQASSKLLWSAPVFVALAMIVPIASFVFLVNSGVQNVRSRRRIRLHEQDHEGRGFGMYRIPWLMQDIRAGLEDAYENMSSAQPQEYLPKGISETTDDDFPDASRISTRQSVEKSESEPLVSKTSHTFPTLALTSAQFAMIDALDNVGFRKYPVHINNSRHSHAVIIRRSERASMREGEVVVKHWLEQDFKI